MKVKHIHFKSIDSTNSWAKRNAQTFEHDKVTLVTADTQTAGRGRFKRKWESPSKQNVYATFCFLFDRMRTDIGNIPQILAVSTTKILEGLGFHPKLKWPNDIQLSEKKVAGILCETTTIDDGLYVILGIGINVNMPLDLLEKIDRPATSLMVEGGTNLKVDRVLELLQIRFMKDLEVFLQKGFPPFIDDYKLRIAMKPHENVRFHDFAHQWEGKFHSINDDGSLNLELNNGEIKRFISGEFVQNLDG